jgi:methionyl aminopeptidase
MAFALQTHAETHGFSVVRDLCSHGIGKKLHEDPLIPNYGTKGKGIKLKEGMTFAIEPMINMGTYHVLTLSDKWTIITADQKLSAHYENTICITKDGAEILTSIC